MQSLTNIYTYAKGVVEVLANYAMALGGDTVDLVQNLYTATFK